jgi:hypothetical protein
MTKLLLIIFFSFLLSGCFHDKSKIAIENCADSRIAKKYISLKDNKPLNKIFLKDQKYNKLLKLKTLKKKEEEMAIKEYENFIDEKYTNAHLLKSFYSDYLYGAYYITKEEIEWHNFKSIAKDGKIKGYVIESRFKLEKAFRARKETLSSSLELMKYTTEKFQKEPLKNKFLDKRYPKYFEKCELSYNKTPNTFIAKWYN